MEHYDHTLEVLGTFLNNPIAFYATIGVIVGLGVFAEIMMRKADRKRVQKNEHR